MNIDNKPTKTMSLKPLKLYELRGRPIAVRDLDPNDATERNETCHSCGEPAKQVVFEFQHDCPPWPWCGHCDRVEDGEGAVWHGLFPVKEG